MHIKLSLQGLLILLAIGTVTGPLRPKRYGGAKCAMCFDQDVTYPFGDPQSWFLHCLTFLYYEDTDFLGHREPRHVLPVLALLPTRNRLHFQTDFALYSTHKTKENSMSETSTLIGYNGRTINRGELALVPTPLGTQLFLT